MVLNKETKMTEQSGQLRQIPIGERADEAVTVAIETGPGGALRAAVWWEAQGDVDADEAEYASVETALAAAQAARALHGLAFVAVVLGEGVSWRPEWGSLQTDPRDREPVGNIDGAALSDDEAFDLAAGIETQSDA